MRSEQKTPKATRRKLVRGFCVGVVLALGACASFIKYREVKLSTALHFSHAKHVEQADCGDCHGEVAQSKSLVAGQFIGKGDHGGCQQCHDDQVTKECSYCHIGDNKQIRFAPTNRGLHFSHAAHSERVKDGCKTCHAEAYNATVPGTKLTPPMATCTNSCHKKDLVAQRCDKCHIDLQRQRLEPLTALGHEGNFIKRHGKLAADAGRCASCHDQTFCSDCHARTQGLTPSIRWPEQIERRFIHRGDYVTRHAIDARQQSMTCNKCHGAAFCSSCHQLNGLSVPTNPSQVSPGTKQVHGPDIMQPGSPGFHGRLARRDIASCASCHDRGAGSNCVKCHSVGGLGGNPHPPGFKWQNKGRECQSNSMCTICHAGGNGC